VPKPVSALYEQGRMRHVGSFPQLQDQMTNFTSDFDREAAGYSPDRLLGLVHEGIVDPADEGLRHFRTLS